MVGAYCSSSTLPSIVVIYEKFVSSIQPIYPPHPPTHPPRKPPSHLLNHSKHPPTHPSIHPIISHSPIPSIPSILPSFNPPTHPTTHPPTHPQDVLSGGKNCYNFTDMVGEGAGTFCFQYPLLLKARCLTIEAKSLCMLWPWTTEITTRWLPLPKHGGAGV